MPDLYLWNGMQYTGNDGINRSYGKLDLASILSGFSGAPPVEIATQLAATTGKATLWTNTGIPTDFLFAVFNSDVGDPTNGYVMLELGTDITASLGTAEYYTVPIRAGIPFLIHSSQSYANYTNNFGGGTLSTIQQIRAKNLNSSAANVSLTLFL